MYRESDQICNELDEAPAEIKDIKFRERWECLSKETTEQVYLEILFFDCNFNAYLNDINYFIVAFRHFESTIGS